MGKTKKKNVTKSNDGVDAPLQKRVSFDLVVRRPMRQTLIVPTAALFFAAAMVVVVPNKFALWRRILYPSDVGQQQRLETVEGEDARPKEKAMERRNRGRKKQRSTTVGEEGKLLHPLRRVLEGALVFSHWKQQQQQHHHHRGDEEASSSHPETTAEQRTEIKVDWNKWKYAMSDDYELTSNQIGLVEELAERVLEKKSCRGGAGEEGGAHRSILAAASDDRPFAERVNAVPWGGRMGDDTTEWWPRKDKSAKVSSRSEGGRLLAAYLKIMKWPKDLHAKFPFKLCAKGCESEVSILHTLEWREKYLPWCMSPNAIQYNHRGFIYHRGHSRPGQKQRLNPDRTYRNNAGHSMVWYRPGRASLANPELYIRSLIHTLELAVADSLVRNNGEIGRFNLVVDCEGVGTKSIPSMAHVKKLFGFLQDHFPDRLGVLLLANLSGVGRMVMNMVMPFVTEDVKAKIHIIPAGEEKRQEMLTQFIELEHVPTWVGGKDDYVFNDKDYYHGSVGGSERCVESEERILEYIETMPYHA